PQTLALHMAILNGEFPRHSQALVFSEPQSPQDRQPGAAHSSLAHYNVPLSGREVELRWLTQQLLEMQEQALHYTLQAADYARRAFLYRQALTDYDAAHRLLQGHTLQQDALVEPRTEWWGEIGRAHV